MVERRLNGKALGVVLLCCAIEVQKRNGIERKRQ